MRRCVTRPALQQSSAVTDALAGGAVAISGGAAQSWQMDNRAHTMHQREFDFGFAIKWMVKDLGYCIDQAKSNNSDLGFTKEVYKRYVSLMDKGHAYSDTSALMLFNALNNQT